MAVIGAQLEQSLGRLTQIRGRITAAQDVYLQGQFEGSVDAPEHKVTVGLTAQVTGNITARELVVEGTVKGNLVASEKIAILHQAHVTGDLRTPRIQIEDGAAFEGSINLRKAGKNEVAKKRPDSASVITEGSLFQVVGGGE